MSVDPGAYNVRAEADLEGLADLGTVEAERHSDQARDDRAAGILAAAGLPAGDALTAVRYAMDMTGRAVSPAVTEFARAQRDAVFDALVAMGGAR